MPLPETPPDGTLPDDFKDWAEDVVDTLNTHNTAIGAGLNASTLTADDQILTRAGGVPAPVTRSTLAADPAFTSSYAAGYTTAATADGSTDDQPQLDADAAAARSAGRPLYLPEGTYRLADDLELTGSVVMVGVPGTVFEKDHTGNGLRIQPAAEAGGTCDTASAGDLTITVTGAGWEVDEHAGKWVALPLLDTYPEWDVGTTYAEDDIVESAGASETKWQSTQGDNLGNTPTTFSDYWQQLSGATKRRVVSNTADTLTLDYALGNDIPASNIEFYTPLDRVVIRDLTVDGGGSGLANIVIGFAREVHLERVFATGCNGNGITVQFCDKVRIVDCGTHDSNFGILVYNSDDVLVDRPKVSGWSSTYGVQLKDCRNGVIRDGWADGEDVGKNGFDVKCSGVNPAWDLHIVGGYAKRTTAAGFKIHTLQNEGDQYGLYNASIIGGLSEDCVAGLQVLETDGLLSAVAEGHRSYRCGTGWSGGGTDVEFRGPIAEECNAYGGNVFRGSGVRVLDPKFINNRQVGAGAELTISVTDTLVTNPEFVHSDAGSLADEAIEESGSADRTRVRGLRVRDTATGYAAKPFTLIGAESVVEGWEDVFIPVTGMYKVAGTGALTGSASYPAVGHQMADDATVTRLGFSVPRNLIRDWTQARIVMVWRPTTTSTNTLRFNAIRYTWNTGDATTTMDGSELSATATPGGVANVSQETSFATTIDVSKERVAIQVSRDANHASDTYPATAILTGVKLERVA